MSSYFGAITSPLRGKAAPRSQAFPVNALSEQEISKGYFDMLQERTTASGAGNNLFYAYARRADHPTNSRYILIFDNVETCDEWWKLIQREYPSQCQRTAAQFFSFNGDSFPHKPATNKKFEHLKTKWFYSQIGDGGSTSGRGLSILPLQDGRGFPIAGPTLPPTAVATGIGTRFSTGRDSATDEDQDREVYAYEEGLKSMEAALEKTATQMGTLAEGHKMAQESLQTFVDRQMAGEEYVRTLAERIETQSTLQERLLKAVEQSVEQARKSGEKSVRFQDQTKGSLEQISQSQKQIPSQSQQSIANEQLMASTLKKMQSSLDQNAAQMRAIAEHHEETMKQMQNALRQNTAQMKSLADSQAKAVTAFSEMLKEQKAATLAAVQQYDMASRPTTPRRGFSSARSNASVASSMAETPPVPSLPMERFAFRSPPRKIRPANTLKTMKSQPDLNVQNDGEKPRPPKLRQSMAASEHARG